MTARFHVTVDGHESVLVNGERALRDVIADAVVVEPAGQSLVMVSDDGRQWRFHARVLHADAA